MNKTSLFLLKKFNLLFLKTPFYDFLINKDIKINFSNKVDDTWGGDVHHAYNFLKGYITFYNETINFNKSIWEKNKSSQLWKHELHAFEWINNFRALGSNEARIFLRKGILDWIIRYNKYSGFNWRSDILGKRICSLMGNFSFFFSSADNKFQEIVLKSICKQGNHLIKQKMNDVNNSNKIYGIKGLIALSLSFDMFRKWQEFSLKILQIEIDNQILSDGCHLYKSPSKHLIFLKNLIDIKSFLARSGKSVPKKLSSTISKMASVVKFFRDSDGSLVNFNDSKSFKNVKINQILLRANSKLVIPKSLGYSGFHKINENKLNFIIDCGNPVKENTFAGSLSFEFSYKKIKIIVNCGSPYINNKEWANAMKSTAAHSTLSIDGINSSDIFFRENPKNSRLAKVWSKKNIRNKCHWIESAHSGYKNIFGLIHSRKIHIDSTNKIIRGQDYLSQTTKNYAFIPKKYFLRFHLHPSIEVSTTGSKRKAILKLPDGCGWEFICSEPKIMVLESIYLGENEKNQKTNHLLISDSIIPEKKIKWLFRLIK